MAASSAAIGPGRRRVRAAAALLLALGLGAAASVGRTASKAPAPASAPGRDFAAERARLAALGAREAVLSARIGANRTSLIRLLSALELWRRDPPPALLVSPQRARDAARAAILMRAIAPELQRRARAFSTQVRALARTRRDAAEAAGALFATESAGADRRIATRGGAHAGPLDAILLSARERQAVADARGDPLALGVDGPAAYAPPPRLSAPVADGAVVRRYGEAWAGRGRSEGWAWAAAPGAPVLAPAEGEVEYAGPLRAWRLVVILRLSGGWRVVLAGLQSVEAPMGARVRSGEALGRAPPAATPPAELYLQLRRGAEPVDPRPYVSAPYVSAPYVSGPHVSSPHVSGPHVPRLRVSGPHAARRIVAGR